MIKLNKPKYIIMIYTERLFDKDKEKDKDEEPEVQTETTGHPEKP